MPKKKISINHQNKDQNHCGKIEFTDIRKIGIIPNVELAKSLGVEIDEHGYIKVDAMMKTNIDGFFAAGDTVNHFGTFKQDITAAEMGTVAATSAYEDNKIHGNLCQLHQVPAKAK